MSDLASFVASNDTYYGPGSLMSTFIGNHDIPRAIHFADRRIGDCRQGSWLAINWTADYAQPAAAEPYERLGVAFAVLMTSPGIPLIYYGDELGLAGGGDPDNRRLMPWDDSSLLPAQLALRDRVSALAHARAGHPVLGRGRRESLSSDQDTWVYRMTGCGDGNDVVVAVNRADSDRTVSVPAGSWTDLLDGGTVSGGSVTLSPRSFLVLGEP
jgi:glycosidase